MRIFNHHYKSWNEKPEQFHKLWKDAAPWMKDVGKMLEKNHANKSLFDAGCGNGILYEYITTLRNEYFGMDLTMNSINFFRERFPGVKIMYGDIIDTEMPSNSSDIVCCFSVLQYIDKEDIDKVLANLFRIAKEYVYLQIPISEETTEIDREGLHIEYNQTEFEEKIKKLGEIIDTTIVDVKRVYLMYTIKKK